MNKKESHKILYLEIGEKLAELGFSKKAQRREFCRPFEGGRVTVHLAYINHVEDYDVTVDIGVRFDQIEDLVNAIAENITKKEAADTYTLGIQLGHLIDGKQLRWNVTSDSDLSNIAQSIVTTFIEYGEPYLNKYSSMEEAYRLLSRDDKEAWTGSPIHRIRAQAAVGLAQMLGKPDLANLIASKERYLREINDRGLANFKEFVEYISAPSQH